VEGIKSKHKISVLSIRYDQKLPKSEVSDLINVYRANYLFKISKGFIGIEVIEKSMSLINKNDILIINQPCFEGLFAAIYARLTGKKVISVFLCFVNFQTSIFSSIISFFMNFFVFLQLLLSDKVVVLTKDYLRQFKVFDYISEKIVEIGPPIRTEKVDTKYYQKLVKLKGNKKWIGFCGRISKEKNIEILISALKNVNCELVIAGPSLVVGEDDYFITITNLLDKAGITYHLLFDLDDARLSAFYQSLDCLVLPSNNSTEALGMVQIEAMMNNIPVVASNIYGVRDPINKTNMGELFDPNNSKDLKSKIELVISNKKNYINKDLSLYQIKFFYQKWQELLIGE
jgi:glycosyltransferase involved in cell wall biosynthesis